MSATPNASIWERAKAEFTLTCVNDVVYAVDKLNNSIQENSRSNEVVAKKLFWLNIAIGLATLVGSIATVVIALKT